MNYIDERKYKDIDSIDIEKIQLKGNKKQKIDTLFA
jgi:hypothetical protein